MDPFKLLQPAELEAATTAVFTGDGSTSSAFLAGGTNLLDLMKMGVERPGLLVDLSALPLSRIERITGNRLRLGALARNSDVAFHAEVRGSYPVLSEALLSGASAQLRNMATVGGNLMQRTRCVYFNDTAFPCNKRVEGSGCPAMKGYSRNLAILGTSDQCIASHPSDMCVALAAIDPLVQVRGREGSRAIPFSEFHLVPGKTPKKETSLRNGELITSVDLPDLPWARRSRYFKVRDRASFEFALVSIAVILDLSGGRIREARLALGGVGTKPWRSVEAERVLAGSPANATSFQAAADAALKDARTCEQNAFKVPLVRKLLHRALTETMEIRI